MVDEHWVEIEVTARTKDNTEAVVHAEYATTAETPDEAAREWLDMAVKTKGNVKVVEIDPRR